jgi:hypothetical protein
MTAAVAGVVLTSLVGVASSVTPTAAQFTDTGALGPGTFSGGSVPVPGPISCSQQPGLVSGYVDLGWTPAPAVRHRLTLQSGSVVVTLTPDVPTGTSSYRLTASAASNLLSLGEVLTVQLQARAGTDWVSSATSTRTLRRSAVLGIGLHIACS